MTLRSSWIAHDQAMENERSRKRRAQHRAERGPRGVFGRAFRLAADALHALSVTPSPERERVLGILRRHGWNSTSFQVLEHGFSYWFDPAADVVVAYVDTGRAWVVAGAPIAAVADVSASGARFCEAARAAGRRPCFFAVENRFADLPWLESVPIGEQPFWDPTAWDDVVRDARSLREQLRRARAKGVVAREATTSEMADPSSPLRARAEALVERWLASRKMAPMGFLVDVQVFDLAEERRVFVAEDARGELLALLVAVPVFARGGWLFEDILRSEATPNGTIELLVDAGMRAAARAGARYVTLGLAPLAGDLTPWLRFARECSKALYDFHGVHRFRAKLKPSGWSPIYLAWPRGGSANAALYDALAAFTMRSRDGHERASFVRFGLETLAHAPALGVRALAVALVPWTVLLALAPTSRFFPSRAIHVSWVVWDAVLVVAMFALAARWRTRLARLLAFGTSLDALLTLTQVAVFDGPRTRSPTEVVLMLVACAGPMLATSLLWGALAWREGRSGLARAKLMP